MYGGNKPATDDQDEYDETEISVINEYKNYHDGDFKYKAKERHWSKKQIVGNDIWKLSAWLLWFYGIMILWYCDYHDIWWLLWYLMIICLPTSWLRTSHPFGDCRIPHLLIQIFGHEQNENEEEDLRNVYNVGFLTMLQR